MADEYKFLYYDSISFSISNSSVISSPSALFKDLRRNPIEDGAISGFSGQKSVPE